MIKTKSTSTWSSYLEKARKLETLLTNTSYQILQENGQRIYAPSSTSGIRPPPKGTEVFVGNLPPDLYEDELLPLFSTKGPIYSTRLMMDFFGRNRGYAFISYFRPENAYAAVAELNNFKIRPRTKMAVTMSVDNRRLFIGNVPRHVNSEEVRQVLEQFVNGIMDVILYKDPQNDKINRGFAFVEFESHRMAAIARRQLAPGNLTIWDQQIFVDWAEPLPMVKPEIMRQVTKLYLSNLPVDISSEQLKLFLFNFLNPLHIVKVHKINNFAFLHFTIRRYAEDAYNNLQGLIICNKPVIVEWARPIEYSKTYTSGQYPDNFCKSVPPSMRRLVQQSVLSKKKSN